LPVVQVGLVSGLQELATAVAPVTRQLFTGLDPNDLAVAHRVLVRTHPACPHDDERCLTCARTPSPDFASEPAPAGRLPGGGSACGQQAYWFSAPLEGVGNPAC
jgi:hypothetical protein